MKGFLKSQDCQYIHLFFGVAKNSKLIAAIKAAIHKKSDRNSFANPLEKDINPDAIRTTRINQSAKFNPKAST